MPQLPQSYSIRSTFRCRDYKYTYAYIHRFCIRIYMHRFYIQYILCALVVNAHIYIQYLNTIDTYIHTYEFASCICICIYTSFVLYPNLNSPEIGWECIIYCNIVMVKISQCCSVSFVKNSYIRNTYIHTVHVKIDIFKWYHFLYLNPTFSMTEVAGGNRREGHSPRGIHRD
jgi:hypothetical protein